MQDGLVDVWRPIQTHPERQAEVVPGQLAVEKASDLARRGADRVEVPIRDRSRRVNTSLLKVHPQKTIGPVAEAEVEGDGHSLSERQLIELVRKLVPEPDTDLVHVLGGILSLSLAEESVIRRGIVANVVLEL